MEAKRRKKLYEQVTAWGYLVDARRYVDEIRERATQAPRRVSPDVQAWLVWAEEHLKELDPLRDGLPTLKHYGADIADDPNERSNPYGSAYEGVQTVRPQYPFWLKGKR